MAPQKKTFSQIAAISAASKGKKIAIGGTGNTDHLSQNHNIVLQSVEEENSSLAITTGRATDEHKSRLSAEGQLL